MTRREFLSLTMGVGLCPPLIGTITKANIGGRVIILCRETWQPEEGAYLYISKEAYIDLGVMPMPNMMFFYEGSTKSGMNGCITSSGYIRFHWDSVSRDIAWPWNPHLFTDSASYPYMDGKIVLDAPSGKITYYENEYAITNSPSFSLPVSISIGARHFDNSYDNKGESIVRHIRYGVGGTVTHDWFPREIDGVAGLYDVIGGGFLTNSSGSGTITYHIGH